MFHTQLYFNKFIHTPCENTKQNLKKSKPEFIVKCKNILLLFFLLLKLNVVSFE